jgi:hypothetical protein
MILELKKAYLGFNPLSLGVSSIIRATCDNGHKLGYWETLCNTGVLQLVLALAQEE